MEDKGVSKIIAVIRAATNPQELESLRIQFEQGVRNTTASARKLLEEHKQNAVKIRELFLNKRKELRMK